jgi:mannitol-1-phosphate/altronate dehydrogenase
MSIKLNKAALDTLRGRNDIQLPAYDINDVRPGIVHFGPSNFARAHLAVYADDLLAMGYKDCGIVMVSPKLSPGNNGAPSPTLTRREILESQDHLYAVLKRNAREEKLRIIGSIRDLVIGPENVAEVIDLMSAPSTHLVTMTVTQNGYYWDKNKILNFDHPDIAQSLENSNNPRATVAYIVRALQVRKEKGITPFGVMSCDNMNHNGDMLRSTVLAYAGQISKDLMRWIADNVPFYNTMVDRIVPKLDPRVSEEIEQKYGLRDQWPLMTEPYKALVIEQKSGVHPLRISFHKAGAKYVEDISPFELAKLRLLNGVHMALGVVGRLHGGIYADEALNDERFHAFSQGFQAEAAATLKPIDGLDYQQYSQELLDRVANPHMKDELQRLARNGTEKISTRFIGPLRDAYAHDLPRDYIVYALASWVRYLALANPNPQDKCDGDGTFCIEDQAAYDLGLVDVARQLNGDISPILSFNIWEGLSNNPVFVKELQEAYSHIAGYERGPSSSSCINKFNFHPKCD